MRLAQCFVVHMAGPLGQPEIRRGKDAEDGARYQYVVEVCYHEVGIVILEVSRCNGQHQAGETADGKQDDEGDRKQHRRLEGQ